MASSQCSPQIIGATGGVCHNNAYMQMVVGPVVAAKLPRCLEHMYQASSLGTWAVEAAFAICAASVLVDDDVCMCVCVGYVSVFDCSRLFVVVTVVGVWYCCRWCCALRLLLSLWVVCLAFVVIAL